MEENYHTMNKISLIKDLMIKNLFPFHFPLSFKLSNCSPSFLRDNILSVFNSR